MSTIRSRVNARTRNHLCLSLIRGVGPRIRQALLEYFGSPEAVLTASTTELVAVTGVGAKLAQRIATARQQIDVDHELAVCESGGVTIVMDTDEGYPRLLREIHDPPGILFVRGALQVEDSLCIAIVGTRHATRYGTQQASRFAAGLVRAGFTIVSGLARGIDAAAHRGALEANGRTLAVLGSGVLNVYPPEHADLANDIARQGAVISELPPKMPPMSGSFPQRNRLVTGISLGVIVVEAAERSGALISAGHAVDQGREVFAIPGRIDNRVARGTHRLLRDGAALVESVDDVLEQLGPLVETLTLPSGEPLQHPAELMLNDQEKRVFHAIPDTGTSIDQLVVTSGLPVHRGLSTISVLEMRKLVVRVSGQHVTRHA